MLKLSQQRDYGKRAPDFALPDTAGEIRTLGEFANSPALLVAFICNHCPFVLHLIDHFAEFARVNAPRGLQVVAISSNDPSDFPEDACEHMPAFAKKHDLPFPYLHDASQEVALAFGAICTPDFFLYDEKRRLVYCGQYDSSRPQTGHPPLPGTEMARRTLPVTGEDMQNAVDAVLSDETVAEHQQPSAGCSITWKPGNNPSWA